MINMKTNSKDTCHSNCKKSKQTGQSRLDQTNNSNHAKEETMDKNHTNTLHSAMIDIILRFKNTNYLKKRISNL